MYVDEILAISMDPTSILKSTEGDTVKYKNGNIEPPELYMDPSLPNLDNQIFTTDATEFKEYYRGAKEEIPHRMPRPRGVAVRTTAFVDSSHGANKVTRRSHSGHILFVNSAPVKCLSRRLQTVENSAFSSEFIVLK